jgi:hypothetical protein
MKSRLALGLAAALLVCAATAGAAKDGAASLEFSTKKPHKQTALTVAGVFSPDAQGNQRVLTSVTLTLPAGTKINKNAVTICPGDSASVSDTPGGAEKACPASSQLGTGLAEVMLGDNETTFDITIWNQQTGPLIELSVNGEPAFTSPGQVSGNKITWPLRLAEQVQAKTKSFGLEFVKRGTAKKPYLRTPSTCPKSKRWKGALSATVSGGGTIKLPAGARCTKR